MTDQPNGERQPAPAASVVVVVFDEPGSARFTVRAENVTPGQLALAAAELDYLWRQHRLQQDIPAQLGGLSLPGMPGFPGATIGQAPRG